MPASLGNRHIRIKRHKRQNRNGGDSGVSLVVGQASRLSLTFYPLFRWRQARRLSYGGQSGAGHDDARVAFKQPAAQKFRHVHRRGVQREISAAPCRRAPPSKHGRPRPARETPSPRRAIRPAAGCTRPVPARCPCPRSILISSLTASRSRWIGSVTLSFTSSARRMRSSVHARRRSPESPPPKSVFAAVSGFPRTRPRRFQKTCPTRSKFPRPASPRCPCATWRASPFSVRGFHSRFSA